MRRSALRIVAGLGALVALGSAYLAISQRDAQASSVMTFTGLGQHSTVRGTYTDASGTAHPVTVSAGEMLATVDGVPTQGYCIDFTHGISGGATLPEADWAQMPVPAGRIDSIAWVLNHYYPQDDPAFPLQGNAAQKAASVQAAIWHFSDGFELGTSGNDPVIAANYRSILDAVPLKPDLGEPITSLKLQTPDATHLAGDLVPVTVRTTGVGKIVNVVVTDGERVDDKGAPASGPVGDGDTFFVRRTQGGTASVAVDARAAVQKGRIFRVPGTQAQILARSVTVDAKASLSVTYASSASVRVVKQSFGLKKDAKFTFSLEAPGLQTPVERMLTFEGTVEWNEDVRPGTTYELKELPTDGWWVAPQSCQGGSAQLLESKDGFRITPKAGEVVTCTFHNVQPGKVIVEKRVTDGSPTDQAFDFTLDDGQTASITPGEQHIFPTVPGAKTVTETTKDGWTLFDVTCTEQGSGQQVKATTAAVQLQVDPGTRWLCVYVNGIAGTTTTSTSSTTSTSTTSTVPPTTTVPPSTTVTSTTVPSTTVAPSTTLPPPSTTVVTDVKGVKETRGTVVVNDTAAPPPGRLARTGSNRTLSFAGVGLGLVLMGGALWFLSRSTTVTPNFVYVGGKRMRRRRK